jgi:hypothetical protein
MAARPLRLRSLPSRLLRGHRVLPVLACRLRAETMRVASSCRTAARDGAGGQQGTGKPEDANEARHRNLPGRPVMRWRHLDWYEPTARRSRGDVAAV